MTKILFAAQKLSVGGIASSLVNLLNVIDSECKGEYEVELFSFTGGALEEEVPSGVTVTYGGRALGLIASSFKEVLHSRNIFDITLRVGLMVYARLFGSDKLYRKLLRKYAKKEKYDIAISYFNDVTTTYFSRGTNLFVSDFVSADTKLAWVHTDPILCRFDADYCREIYKNFDKIMCVSKAVKDKMDMLLPEYSDKTEVCYNRFCKDMLLKKADMETPFDSSSFNIVTVGRIDNDTKRIDGIVRLCKRLKDDGICSFKWRIVGGGPDLDRNIALANELCVTDVIEFVGEKKNPYPYIKNSDIFALYSAYEGFPMVIGEAKILGTYVLTSPYAAASEQIGAGDGQIAQDDEDFYMRLCDIIKAQ